MSAVLPDPATTDWVPIYNLFGGTASMYSARVYRSTNQSIPSGTWTAVTFDTVRWDRGGQWAAGSPTRLTCQVAGTYLLYAHGQYVQAAGGGHRLFSIKHSGNDVSYGGTVGATFISGPYPIGVAPTVREMQAGDYIEMWTFQDSGAALNLNPSNSAGAQASLEMGMTLLGGPQGPPGVGVPAPVVNGQWIYGSGGAAIWKAFAASDIPGYPTDPTKALMGDGAWRNVLQVNTTALDSRTRIQGGYVQVNAPTIAITGLDIILPQAWTTSHTLFLAQSWPNGTWAGYKGIYSCLPNGLTKGTVMFDNANAQTVQVNWISFGW